MTIRNTLFAIHLSMLFFPVSQIQAQGSTAQFALTGDAVPDGNGFLGLGISTPILNNSGDVFFVDQAISGTAGAPLDTIGLFRASPTSLFQIVRSGEPAPDGNGFFTSFGYNTFSDNGSVAFRGGLGGTTEDNGVFRGNGGALTQVARAGQAAPANGIFSSLGQPAIHANDRVVFNATLTGTSGGSADDNAIYRDNVDGSLTEMAREGQVAPDGNGRLGNLSAPLVNANGFVGFHSLFMTNTSGGVTDDAGVYISRDGSLIQVAREGQASPDGNGFLGNLAPPSVLTDGGQMVFLDILTGTSGGNLDNAVVLRGDAAGLVQIAREGQTVPGGNGEFSSFGLPGMNENGDAVFRAVVRNSVGVSLDDTGFYRGTGTRTIEIAREGQAAPDGNGEISDLIGSASNPAINDAGTIAFRAFFRNTAGGFEDDVGIVLADGIDTVQVVREGDSLGGSTVSFVSFRSGPTPGGDGLNEYGQVAYHAKLANGNEGIFVFTPELHWRSTFSSSWDGLATNNPGGLNNWTLSLRPDIVHDTFIDPDTSLTVFGPATDTTVKSLTIGGGNGIATLSLGLGTITPLEGIRINDTGRMSGDGVINGTVTNFGEVMADNITMTSLVNNGIVSGTTAVNNRINARLVNQTGGEVIASNGQSIRFTAANNTNSGTIESIGGEVRFDQILVNEVGGDIFASDATLRFNGGLANIGRIGLTIGSSFIFGGINNIGSVIQSGAGTATFFDNFTNNGTVQVSAGSTAVFFGAVSGPGAFTGTGTVFFEGTVSPGASPGQVSVEGDLNLGLGAHTLMEIGGLVRGDEYDAFDIGGSLNILGGELEVSLFDTGGGLFAPKLGDSFDLFSAESISGGFDVMTLAVLGQGLGWQLDFLTDAVGTLDIARLSVVASAVPVPAAVWLFGSGLLGLVAVALKRRSNREKQTL